MRLCVGMSLLIILLRSGVCRAEESVVAFGTESSSGNTILCLVSLGAHSFNSPVVVPDNPTRGREDSFSPLKYSVISRGVVAPTQGAKGTILYWKGFRLWRYGSGVYRELGSILDNEPIPHMQEAIELQGESGMSRHLALRTPDYSYDYHGTGTSLIALTQAKDESDDVNLPPPPKGFHSEPLAWLDTERLLVREFRLDRLNRLRASKLVILTPSKASEDGKERAGAAPLTNLPESMLEVTAAATGTKVVLQVYDEMTQKFRLGVLQLSDKNREVNWLPIPPGRRPGWFESRFDRQISEMEWSPDGRYLEVVVSGGGVSVWDSIGNQWMKRGSDIVFTAFEDRNGFLWLDSDRVLSFEASSQGSTFLLAGRMSEFARSVGQIGEIKGIIVEKLFRISLLPGNKAPSQRGADSGEKSASSAQSDKRP